MKRVLMILALTCSTLSVYANVPPEIKKAYAKLYSKVPEDQRPTLEEFNEQIEDVRNDREKVAELKAIKEELNKTEKERKKAIAERDKLAEDKALKKEVRLIFRAILTWVPIYFITSNLKDDVFKTVIYGIGLLIQLIDRV